MIDGLDVVDKIEAVGPNLKGGPWVEFAKGKAGPVATIRVGVRGCMRGKNPGKAHTKAQKWPFEWQMTTGQRPLVQLEGGGNWSNLSKKKQDQRRAPGLGLGRSGGGKPRKSAHEGPKMAF